jgi:hypothetical protein
MQASKAPDKHKQVRILIFLQQRIKHMLTANFEEQRGQHGRSYESAEAQFEVNMQNLHRMVREHGILHNSACQRTASKFDCSGLIYLDVRPGYKSSRVSVL